MDERVEFDDLWPGLPNGHNAERKPTFGLGWGPIHDGNFLPYQTTDPAAIDLSSNIPLLVGSTKNEFTPFNPATCDITMDGVKPYDYLDIDFDFRPLTVRQANGKAIPGAAPVYMYLFTWQSPVMDGMYKGCLCPHG